MALDRINATALLDGGVSTADLANDSVTTAKIAAGAVDTTELASGAVTTAKIASGAVDTTELASGAVTSAKLDTNIDVAGTLDVTGVLTADSAGSVAGTFGIGTTSPGQTLEVNTGNDSNGIRIRRFSGSYYSDIVHTSTPEGLKFMVGDGSSVTERLRILGTGGITFNGDTAEANALQDYEEGSWTPSIGADATYTNQQGIYTKIGRYVSAAFDITINARNSGSQAQMFGLPFTVNNSVTPVLGVHSGHISFYSSLAQNVYSLDMYAINGQTYVYFTGHTIATGNIGNALSVFGNGTRIVGTVHYYAN